MNTYGACLPGGHDGEPWWKQEQVENDWAQIVKKTYEQQASAKIYWF